MSQELVDSSSAPRQNRGMFAFLLCFAIAVVGWWLLGGSPNRAE